MKLTNLFSNTRTQPNTTSFWPSCSQQPKTLSFRSIRWEEGLFKDRRVGNISYNNDSLEQPPRCSETAFIEDLLEDEGVERMERVTRALKSDRLFFELGETNSILGEAKNSANSNKYCSNVEKSVTLMPMESLNPYLDFKKSMEEMVDADHGVKTWDWFQELLGCYLKVNEKRNHEFIIGAFVGLLVGLDLEGLELIHYCSSFVASSSSPMRFSSSDMISISFCSTSTSNLPADEISCSS